MIQRLRKAFGMNTGVEPGKTKDAGPNDMGWAKAPPMTQGSGATTTLNDAVWAFAGVQDMAVSIASLPFQLKDRKDEEITVETSDRELREWRILFDNPHPLLEPMQLWEITTMLYEIQGLCYWLLQKSDGEFIDNRFDRPEILTPVGSAQVTPRYDLANKHLIGWWWQRPGSATKKPLEFWQVLRFYKTNPSSITEGLKLTDLIGKSIGLSKGVKEANENFFKNGARLEGHIEYEGDLPNEDIKEFRDDYDDSIAGIGNHGRTPVFMHGFKYVHDQSTPKDMDYENLSIITREEMLAGVRVPKHHLGLTDGINRATADITDRVYWQNNLIPKIEHFMSVCNSKLFYTNGLTCNFDYSGVYILKQDLNEKLKAAKSLYSLGYPVNAIATMLDIGMPEIEDEWANEAHEPSAQSESDPDDDDDDDDKKKKKEDDEDEDKGAPAPFSEADIKARLRSVVEIEQSAISIEPCENKDLGDMIDAALTGDQNAIDTFIQNFEAEVINPVLPGFEKVMESYFKRLEKSQLRKLQAFLDGESYADIKAIDGNGRDLTQNDIDRVLFAGDKWDKIIQDASLPFHKKTFKASLVRVERELGGFINFDPASEEMSKEIIKTNNKIVGINKRVRQQLRQNLSRAVAGNYSQSEAIKAVRQVFDAGVGRVATIARTEAGMAAGRARWRAISANEGFNKTWLTSGDEIVRETHRKYGKLKPQNLSYEYAPGLMYPLDASGSPGEIINCRCVLVKGVN